MSGKNQFPNVFNWQSNDPSANFQPTPYQPGSLPSGNPNGAMAATNTIYSQIVDVSKMDNIGLQVDWSATAVGVFSVMGSNNGTKFHALTFIPVLAQPAGVAGGMIIDLNQFPWKYVMLQYVNASGAGILTASGQNKDLN